MPWIDGALPWRSARRPSFGTAPAASTMESTAMFFILSAEKSAIDVMAPPRV